MRKISKLIVMHVIIVVGFTLLLLPQIPVLAVSSCSMACSMMPNCVMNLDTLPDCIKHHWEMGDILSIGVYQSLLAKTKAAIMARDLGQNGVAIKILHAFIAEVNALRSNQIKDMAADCIMMHAWAAIQSLQ